MSDHYILGGSDGKTPIMCDLMTWARSLEGRGSRIVAKEYVYGSLISTVFLGLDHNYGEGPPLLFETLVFGGPMDGECRRCTTWQEAEEQHEAMVERVKDAYVSPV
jgi:hypothetical protein